jgi:hypothetical protein
VRNIVVVSGPVPAPIAPLVGFLLGVAFAWLAAEELARAEGFASRSMIAVSLFGLLAFAPVAGYFLAFAPDWSYAYFVDSRRLPGAVDLTFVLIDAASVPAGFAAAARYAKTKRSGSLLRVLLVPLVLAVGFLLIAFPRLGIDATYAQYQGDFGTRSVSGSPLGYALLWMTLVLCGAIAWTAVWLRRSSRAARRD